MAKLFIETYSRLSAAYGSPMPLAQQPPMRATELTIPTNAATQPSWVINRGELVLRVLPRAHCAIFLRTWAEGTAETTAVDHPLTTHTENASEYISMPVREGNNFNLKLFVRNDLS
ncbi:hypothetical protein BJAS_P3478 [Bathymodiolus japonicus methanotrophic gill symbiont]|uniref:hypothetical protein n=1 Tax=Bathymodiolus japonicus methanotrophic gill symbiont TaxID=113269 RepID=UPI001B5BEE83|nr:hypothetical protein [Bathymodiolus japonicus methanotrophic gill symbiont]GFO72941.1 hypothetical protein BJAS_P3478 [Bathymodiolus japonicus methanotrophic gill symbiont]